MNRSPQLEQALRAKGWYDTTLEEKVRQCEEFIRSVKGKATGDIRAGVTALRELRGTA